MDNPGNFGLIVWILSIFCLVCLSLGYEPADNYLIDCGSSKNVSVGDRVFLGDNSSSSSFTLSTPQQILATSNSNSNSNSNSISTYYDSALYQTARIFSGRSDYSFPIKEQGRHFIRLHFFPFVFENYNMNQAKFSVSAQNFTLLTEPQLGNDSFVKEYNLNITSNKLVLSFTPASKSFAFINALEVSSVPENLIPEEARIVDPKGGTGNRHLSGHILETVARVDMGNSTVLPQDDTLWRLWVSDDAYRINKNLGSFVRNVSAVNFTGGGVTEDIAPASVYGTATTLDSTNIPVLIANLTWSFDVEPMFDYLVRLHFCDIVSNSTTQGISVQIYINSGVADHLDLGSRTSDVLGAPYFLDLSTTASAGSKLNVSVGPYNSQLFPIVILNGLEIMKMSNPEGSLDVPDDVASRTSNTKVVVIVGLAVGLFVLVVLAAALFLFCRKKRSVMGTEEQFSMNGGQKVHTTGGKYANGTAIFSSSTIGYRFPFMAILEATDNFSENFVIGVGGFGKVYRGVLRDETEIAVKRGAPQSNQGLAEFRTEIEMLSQFRHRHLVSLIGYCDEQNEMIIIYEYMENGTLKNYLYGSNLPSLTWRQRLEICIGSAKGLHYLHTGSNKGIIHRDVKSANILLDKNFMAKVADFGLSKTGPDIDQTHVSTAVKGSFGYLDPEYLTTQQLTEKSDVYSFGVVLLEVLCGRPVIDPSLPREKVNLVDWTKSYRNGKLEEIVDPTLVDQIKSDSLRKFWDITQKCLAQNGINRPTMGDVLWNLESALQLQGNEEKSSQNGQLSSQVSNVSTVETSLEFSRAGSVGDLAGISMSTVFAQMVREDMR